MISKEVLENWENQHWRRIFHHLKSEGIALTRKNIPKIIKATSFQVMSRKYKGKKFEGLAYCLWYDESPSRPCHPEIKDLNCLTCACPNYQTDRNGGGCKINSKKGLMYKNQVWDCSGCNFGHSPEYATRFLQDNLDSLKKLSETL